MTDTATWVRESASELHTLIQGEGRDDERVLQRWLERHPVFVPGYRGPRGMSSWLPWPSALITQPRLIGFRETVPDFCWLSVDSAELTAVLVEIEKPAKRWQRDDGGQAAELTHARDQLNAWKTWFSRPENAVAFLNDYLVPSDLRDLHFTQHYVLVHGSRSEYDSTPGRIRLRSTIAGDDETLMSFDRLVELPDLSYAHYGCVTRRGDDYEAVAVPPTWDPDSLDGDALRVTRGYPKAIAESGLTATEQAALLARFEARRTPAPASFRYRPQRR